jgi:hypothetical protein
LAPHQRGRQPEALAHGAHLVLMVVPQRLDDLAGVTEGPYELRVVVVRLDDVGASACLCGMRL